MKKVQNKNIDDIFKHSLEDPAHKAAYNSNDWDALELMLDGGEKKPRKMIWLPLLSSAAAVLLIAFGWWLFTPQNATDKTKVKPQVASNHQQKTGQQVVVVEKPVQTKTAASAGVNVVEKAQPSTEKINSAIADNAASPKKTEAGKAPIAQQNSVANAGAVNAANSLAGNTPVNNGLPLTNASQAGIKLDGISSTQVLAAADITKPLPNNQAISSKWADDEDGSGITKSVKRGGSGVRPQLGLSIIAASELNGMNTLQQSNAGSNFGLLFSVGFKKLTISTGATYSTKPYAVGFSSYTTGYKFTNSPQTVTADCRLLDIPINIDYQLYNKRNNKFSIGTGLSSYLMLHESYAYTYADPATAGPSQYTVKSPGRYMFSIMNLQATYQRQINSKFGVSVQPYLKLPLADIGYGQVKLQTLGVAVGVNWSINSLSKPK